MKRWNIFEGQFIYWWSIFHSTLFKKKKDQLIRRWAIQSTIHEQLNAYMDLYM